MKVALLGYGTVGSGVVKILQDNKELIEKKVGEPLELKYVLDLREFPNSPIQSLLTKDFNEIVADKEVKIVAEAMGGTKPAYQFAKQLLESGKSYVTSNKELVAQYGAQLLEIAKKNHVQFLFEASVGGGIPIIRSLCESITADDIEEITGILNGTTNYILTKMQKEGRTFEDVLKEAQELGYAEKNPAADVEGYDACRKIAILASLTLGEQVNFEDIPTEGISHITKEDMEYANKMHYVIKLLGSFKKQPTGMSASVAPVMIPMTHPLAMVNDVFNAIFVKGNMVDDLMFYGKGAGSLPTASAVVADMVDAARNQDKVSYITWNREKTELCPKDEHMAKYFVRLKQSDCGTASRVKEIFGTFKEIEALEGEYAFITEVLKEKQFEHRLSKIGENCIISKMRVEE